MHVYSAAELACIADELEASSIGPCVAAAMADWEVFARYLGAIPPPPEATERKAGP